MKDCTFLLSSYDNGEDCWKGFFCALSDCWPELDMPIVLNTESKGYRFPGYEINTFSLYKDRDAEWSERLIETLKRIDTEFVLLFLEDFWLDKPVDNDFFEITLQWMRDNPDVANISYYPCMPGTNIMDNRFERFERRPRKCEYKLNFQVGLWRREKLISFLRPHESPWEVEILGSKRATRYKDSFYCLKEGAPFVFSYGDNLTGCVVHRGKWVKEAVLPFNDKYNLDIDFSIRGFEDFEAYQKECDDYINTPKIKILLKSIKRPHFLRRVWKKVSRYLKSFI